MRKLPSDRIRATKPCTLCCVGEGSSSVEISGKRSRSKVCPRSRRDRSADPKRDAMPVASDAERSMQNALRAFTRAPKEMRMPSSILSIENCATKGRSSSGTANGERAPPPERL
jgi:hypothetical protein